MNNVNKYFTIFSSEYWSLENFNAFTIGNNNFANKRATHRVFYNDLLVISNDDHISKDWQERAEELLKNRKSDVRKVDKMWMNINAPENSGDETASVAETSGDGAMNSCTKKRKLSADTTFVSQKKKKTNLLSEALSHNPPPVKYPSDTSISVSTRFVGGIWPPTKIGHWNGFFDEVTQFNFDQEQRQYKKPKFIKNLKIHIESDVDAAIMVNIFQVLNTLIGPYYEFSKQKNSDFKDDPNIGKEKSIKLYISKALPLNSTSPSVLKAYAYLAYLANDDPESPHPSIIGH
ncbi:hypothetical protein RclHR1_08070019 [Rhizophagus clarus]|uniref:Uncharacterized protein n=1 Tax=Rhizophagus clarus TaxID=94130 RepID=A0A2Z6SAZ8_9GLOM|nr:hypothetical protein RclHR1_08070019 [Rhizophagus clarus]